MTIFGCNSYSLSQLKGITADIAALARWNINALQESKFLTNIKLPIEGSVIVELYPGYGTLHMLSLFTCLQTFILICSFSDLMHCHGE